MSDTWSVIWMGCELLFHRGISQEAHGSSRVDMSIPCCTNPSWSMSHDRASVRTQTTRNRGGEQSQGNLCPSPSQRGWPRAGCISGSHCPGEVTRVWVLTENATSLADTRTTVPNRAERKRKSPNTVQYANDHIQLYENNCSGMALNPCRGGQCAAKPRSVWCPCIGWSPPGAVHKRSSRHARLSGSVLFIPA